jgi:hypothetical protein
LQNLCFQIYVSADNDEAMKWGYEMLNSSLLYHCDFLFSISCFISLILLKRINGNALSPLIVKVTLPTSAHNSRTGCWNLNQNQGLQLDSVIELPHPSSTNRVTYNRIMGHTTLGNDNTSSKWALVGEALSAFCISQCFLEKTT